MKSTFTLSAALFFCVILNSGSLQSNQSNIVESKFSAQFSEVKSSYIQDTIKYQYVGAEECASACHNNEKTGFQYNVWKDGPHAKAFKALSSKKAIRYAKKEGLNENPQESSTCLQCHVTGSGLDSSFLTATYNKEDGVTCESCHKHKHVPKTFRPKETDCIECHNGSAHKMHQFNFSKDYLKIEHLMPKNP